MEKNEEKKEFVCLLVCEWSNDGETGNYVKAFRHQEDAAKYMANDYNEFFKDVDAGIDKKWNDFEFEETHAYCAVMDDWGWFHCTWDIQYMPIN